MEILSVIIKVFLLSFLAVAVLVVVDEIICDIKRQRDRKKRRHPDADICRGCEDEYHCEFFCDGECYRAKKRK